MKALSIVKAALGSGAAILLAGLLAAAPAAQASAGVTVPCSSGSAGLIAAISAANSTGGGTISLVSGCNYALGSADNGENGLPVVMSRIALNGNGATISGNNTDFRIFEVDGPGGSLALQNVTITGGSATDFGGGIFNSGGTVTLNHSLVTGNSAGMGGGGIASGTFGPSTGSLTLNNSQVTKNTSGVGGGIVNNLGTATLNSSQVNGNRAGGFAGGGIATGNYSGGSGTSSLTLNSSQVNGNIAPNAGGGGI